MTYHNLTCDEFSARLGEYLEGDLDDAAVAGAELHLAACADCRTLVADLSTIAREARTLAPLVPARELWSGIEARIATPVATLPARTARARWTLGAIAAALVAATALSTWQIARRTAPAARPVAAVPPVEAPARPLDRSAPSPAPAASRSVTVASTPREARPDARTTYATEIRRLEQRLGQRANDLDPATVAIIESSIATIDSAIAEAKAALARDPASGFLESQLNKSLERKLGLLRRATLLSAS